MFIEILREHPDYFNLSEIEGYPEDKISELERKFDVILPTDYKIFLTELGGNAGNLLLGDFFLGYHIEELQSDLRTLFEENNCEYNEKYFCIFMHDGYTADLYSFNESEIAIYQFNDGYNSIKKTHDNFMEYFKEKVRFHILMIDDSNI